MAGPVPRVIPFLNLIYSAILERIINDLFRKSNRRILNQISNLQDYTYYFPCGITNKSELYSDLDSPQFLYFANIRYSQTHK